MNWGGRTERHKITTVLIWLVPAVLQINVHLDHVVVFVVWRFFEKEFFPDNDLLGRGALKLHNGIRSRRSCKLFECWRGRVLEDCADWQALIRIQNNLLPFFGYLLEQNRFLNSATAICQS